MVENAFGLSPLVSNSSPSILPHLVWPGSFSPMALTYDVPVSQLDDFSFTPQATDNLLSNWFGADSFPQYFLISSTPTNGTQNAFSVEPNLANWPGDTNQIFIRLKINEK